MDYTFLADLYAKFGVEHPKITYGAVFVIGGLLASFAWWTIGLNYERQQTQIARASGVDDRVAALAAEIKALRDVNDASRRRTEQRAQIVKFMSEGQQLQKGFLDSNTLGPLKEGQVWLERLKAYIGAEMGEIGLQRLDSTTGQMPFRATIKGNGPHAERNQNAWIQVNIRLLNLQQFVSELSP